MTPGKLLNRILFPFRLRLERLPADYYGLRWYAERARPASPAYLNIGALDFPHPLWHKLDNPTELQAFARRQRHIDVPHDLTSARPLPLADNSLKIAYCSHVIEHLSDDHVARLFGEVHRTLQPGGTFRVVAPDADLFLRAYLRNDADAFRPALSLYRAETIEQRFLMQFASALVRAHPARLGNRPTDEEIRDQARSRPAAEFFSSLTSRVPVDLQRDHPADHMNWFTPAKTVEMLRKAGLSDVRLSACGQSALPLLRNRYLFDPYPDHSLYVECTK